MARQSAGGVVERRLPAAIGVALGLRVLLDLSSAAGLGSVGAPISAVALAGLALLVGLRGPERVERGPVLFAVGVFVVALLAAAPRGTEPVYWLGLYLGPMVVLLAARSARPTDGWRWARWVGMLAWVPLLWAGVALVQGQPATVVVNDYPRLLGGYANPHNHAVALVVFASIGALFADAGSGRGERAAGLLLATVSAGFLGLTWVRTGFVMLAVHLAVFLALRRRLRLLALCGGLAVLALGISPGLQDRFSDLGALLGGGPPEGGWGAVGSWRGRIWADSWAHFVDAGPQAPWIGLGLGAHHTLHKALDPHSDVLSLLYQAGVSAPLAWLAVVGLSARRVLTRRAAVGNPRARAFQDHALAWSVALVLCWPVSNDVLPRMTLLWWTLAALGAAAMPTPPESEEEPGPSGSGDGDREVVVDPHGE